MKKTSTHFLEVECGAHSLSAVEDILAAAGKRDLPCKLTWQGATNDALLDLITRFRIHSVAGLNRPSPAIINHFGEAQTVLVVNCADMIAGESRDLAVREILDRDGPLALAPGYDPIRSPMFNMHMAVALAVLLMDMTTADAITAATITAACASGISDRVGSLEYGKDADLLMLNLTDYRDIPRQFGVNHVGLALRAGSLVFNRIGWKPVRAGEPDVTRKI